jgi:hypothetical protein
MKYALPILVIIAIMPAGLIPNTTAAPINRSFESGSFSGWQIDIATGHAYSQRGYRPAGTAQVVSSWNQLAGLNPARTAMDGGRFAMLGTLANGNFTGHRTYDISVDQDITLTAGMTLSGWAFFFNGDTEAQDSAWVRILDDAGATVTTPWLEFSGCNPTSDFDPIPYRSASLWTQWSWQVPESGAYTLSFGMTTADDNNYASYGFFDGFLVAPPTISVPEPSAVALASLGALALLRQRRLTPQRNN